MTTERATRKPQFAVGLDCGLHTGVAIYDREAKCLAGVFTLDFWRAYDFVTSTVTPETAVIVVEVPNTRGALYARTDAEVGRGSRGRDRFAANVGSNRREAVLLADGFERLGFDVRREIPRGAKWTVEQVRRYTGYEGRTSEHARDAIRLVYGY